MRGFAIRSGECFLLMYSVSSHESLENLHNIIELVLEIREHYTEIKKLNCIVVGNKSDCDFPMEPGCQSETGLPPQRQVSQEEGQKFAAAYGLPWIEVSSTTGTNLSRAIFSVVLQVLFNAVRLPLISAPPPHVFHVPWTYPERFGLLKKSISFQNIFQLSSLPIPQKNHALTTSSPEASSQGVPMAGSLRLLCFIPLEKSIFQEISEQIISIKSTIPKNSKITIVGIHRFLLTIAGCSKPTNHLGEPKTGLEGLPEDILKMIFKYLMDRDVLMLCQANKNCFLKFAHQRYTFGFFSNEQQTKNIFLEYENSEIVTKKMAKTFVQKLDANYIEADSAVHLLEELGANLE